MHCALLSLLYLPSDKGALGALFPLAEVLLSEGSVRVVQGAQPVASAARGFCLVVLSFHYNTDETTRQAA